MIKVDKLELNPECLAVVDEDGYLPLHRLLLKYHQSIENILSMIDAYPAALKNKNRFKSLPIHVECIFECRSSIIAKCIELYPEGLTIASEYDNLPLHAHLGNWFSSSMQDALMIIEAYPAALKHQNRQISLPIHVECKRKCRSPVLVKCMELYPEGLSFPDIYDNLPLFYLLANESSTVEDALMMIEKYPAALKYDNRSGTLPIHVECRSQCRSVIIAKCLEVYPEAMNDNRAISSIVRKGNCKKNFHSYASAFSILFTARPRSLYAYDASAKEDIRYDTFYRRKILNLLPRHVFRKMHVADYADLNWQYRSAILLLLSQIHQQSRSSKMIEERLDMRVPVASAASVKRDNWRNLLMQIILNSTWFSPKADSGGLSMQGLCQNEDVCTRFLRSTIAFL